MKNALDQKIREREMRSEDMKRTDAYAKLSEEDQEALRLGREMLKNQSEEKKIYTMRRKKRNIRRIVALAAVLILVMAVGMTSIGGPERMLQFMKSSVGGRQVSKVNSSDKNKIIEEEDEEKAYEKIAEEFGIEPVRIIWHPEEMKFEKMLMDTDIQLAELDYLYNGEKTTFMISASYGETSWGYDEEDEMIQKQNDGSMIANGLTELEDLEDLIPVTFDKEDYETLNGFLIDELEHIPGEDEKCVVDYEGYRFTALQVDNNIIQTVKIEKLPEA